MRWMLFALNLCLACQMTLSFVIPSVYSDNRCTIKTQPGSYYGALKNIVVELDAARITGESSNNNDETETPTTSDEAVIVAINKLSQDMEENTKKQLKILHEINENLRRIAAAYY